jgi:DNA-binding NtrC family response regulator
MTRVLLVDDDDDATALLGALLSRKGFDVAVARSVVEAHQQLDQASFDVVVTDHQLGDGDARDVLARIGAARGVVLTGHSTVPVAEGTVVLQKPVDMPRLIALLQSAPSTSAPATPRPGGA